MKKFRENDYIYSQINQVKSCLIHRETIVISSYFNQETDISSSWCVTDRDVDDDSSIHSVIWKLWCSMYFMVCLKWLHLRRHLYILLLWWFDYGGRFIGGHNPSVQVFLGNNRGVNWVGVAMVSASFNVKPCGNGWWLNECLNYWAS